MRSTREALEESSSSQPATPNLDALAEASKQGDKAKMASLLEHGNLGRKGFECALENACSSSHAYQCLEYLLNANPSYLNDKEMFIFILDNVMKRHWSFCEYLFKLSDPKIEWLHEYIIKTGFYCEHTCMYDSYDGTVIPPQEYARYDYETFLSLCWYAFKRYGLEFSPNNITNSLLKIKEAIELNPHHINAEYRRKYFRGFSDLEYKAFHYWTLSRDYHVFHLDDPNLVSVFEGYLDLSSGFLARRSLHKQIEKVVAQLLHCDNEYTPTPEQLCRFEIARRLNKIFYNQRSFFSWNSEIQEWFQEIVTLEAKANLANGSIIKRFFETMMVRMKHEVNGQRKLIVSLELWNALKEGYLNAVAPSSKDKQAKVSNESTTELVTLLKGFTHPSQVACSSSSSATSSTSKDNATLADPIHPPTSAYPDSKKELDPSHFLDYQDVPASNRSIAVNSTARIQAAIRLEATSTSSTASTSDYKGQIADVSTESLPYLPSYNADDDDNAVILPNAPQDEPIAPPARTMQAHNNDDDDDVVVLPLPSAPSDEPVAARQAARI